MNGSSIDSLAVPKNSKHVKAELILAKKYSFPGLADVLVDDALNDVKTKVDAAIVVLSKQ
ncbi:hypothetical protein HQN90_13955 [Paenibacillus alba]|uniref:hypothetical protein n=1 Tax=Paenibacillus alba TaxID=1197127 RepID=UPI001566279C|nr:hypothetical protein [Paenibacillus alba]NQX67220.1 hypothetical protein [Paenibacillus alba]